MFKCYCFYFFYRHNEKKILRSLLKTKNCIEANRERLNKIEFFLNNSTSHSQNMNTNSYEVKTENIFAGISLIQINIY